MNRIYLIIFSLLITLSFVIGKSSACPPSGRPRCNIYGPTWIIAGQVVEFTSSSYDPDGGPIEEYQWRLIWCDDCTIVSGQNTEEMSCKFDTGCTAYVKLRVRDNEDMWSSWDYHKVYVMKVSLSGGGYICLGDRVPISLSVEAHDPDDAWFELDDPSDDDKIEVWDGQTEVELPAGWSVSGVPDTLDVKGISTSSGLNDVQLELLYINTAPRNPTVIDSDSVEFTVVEVDVTHIKFDHSAGDSSDAIDITEDDSTDIDVPEWVKGGQNKPAAYKKSTSVTIKARFTVSPTTITSAKICATTSDSILGNLAEQTVTFSSGISNPEYISFTPANPTTGYIDKDTITWQWKVHDIQGSDSPECTFGSSGPHTIYIVLDSPKFPQYEPWQETLDIACAVCFFDACVNTVMHSLWNDFYKFAGGVYDTEEGAPGYTSDGEGSKFKLTRWLNKYPSIEKVNCYDMSKAVVVFARALGCWPENSFVEPFGYLNCIKPIGCGWTNNPFYGSPHHDDSPIVDGDAVDDGIPWNHAGRSGFSNHAFARYGGWIYDASVGKVDVDADPDDGPTHIARELDGDDKWGDYKYWVIDGYPPSTSPQDHGFDVE